MLAWRSFNVNDFKSRSRFLGKVVMLEIQIKILRASLKSVLYLEKVLALLNQITKKLIIYPFDMIHGSLIQKMTNIYQENPKIS